MVSSADNSRQDGSIVRIDETRENLLNQVTRYSFAGTGANHLQSPSVGAPELGLCLQNGPLRSLCCEVGFDGISGR